MNSMIWQKILFGRKCLILLVFYGLFLPKIFANDTTLTKQTFFKYSDNYSKKRFGYAFGFCAASYVGFSYGFYNSWYAKYPQSNFHLFNDVGEWNQMDKAGHIFSGYFQASFVYNGGRWCGMPEKKSIAAGLIAGALFQSTIEVMDGFSTEWGFSLGDIAGNTIGLSTFYLQQKVWGEQRIVLKESAWPKAYAPTIVTSIDGTKNTTIRERALSLYGSSWGERALKDYNVQAYWASFHIKSFFPTSNWPSWLNLAAGYGADNMYGGFENEWEVGGSKFELKSLARKRQFYLALDYDLRKIKVKNQALKSVLKVLDIYKFPAPAIEFNTTDGIKFHLLLYRG